MQDYSTLSHASAIGSTPLRRKKGETASCPGCGNSFMITDYRQIYCSRPCYQAWWTRNRQLEMSDKGAKGRNEQVKGQHAEEAADEETLWALRAEYWQRKADAPREEYKPASRNKEKDKERPPLVLSGHGVQLRIDHGALLVRNGFTHYPQEQQEWRLFPGDRKLPNRIILLESDGSITLDVIGWLNQQSIPLILLNWQGEVISAFGDTITAADPKLRNAQIAAQTNGEGLLLCVELIRQKITASMTTLRTFSPSDERDVALCRLEDILQELAESVPNVEAIRWIEGRAAFAYFTYWQTISLKWKGTIRHPVPNEWHVIGQRLSLLSGFNRHATHPMNALLNYAYAVLESQVRIATITAGLDPTIGYLHACRPGRPALVYDLMEPLRAEVDRLLLKFVRSHTFSPSDFPINAKGSCRLHPQLARSIAGMCIAHGKVNHITSECVFHLTHS